MLDGGCRELIADIRHPASAILIPDSRFLTSAISSLESMRRCGFEPQRRIV